MLLAATVAGVAAGGRPITETTEADVSSNGFLHQRPAHEAVQFCIATGAPAASKPISVIVLAPSNKLTLRGKSLSFD